MAGPGEILRLYAQNGLLPWLMEPVAEHLARWEVICRCGVCFRCALSPEMKLLWSVLRERAAMPLVIASGLRCPAHQRKVNSAVSDSMHLHGEALDIRWPLGMERRAFLDLAETVAGKGGLGVYPWGIHIDTGKGKAPRRRWGKFKM